MFWQCCELHAFSVCSAHTGSGYWLCSGFRQLACFHLVQADAPGGRGNGGAAAGAATDATSQTAFDIVCIGICQNSYRLTHPVGEAMAALPLVPKLVRAIVALDVGCRC